VSGALRKYKFHSNNNMRRVESTILTFLTKEGYSRGHTKKMLISFLGVSRDIVADTLEKLVEKNKVKKVKNPVGRGFVYYKA